MTSTPSSSDLTLYLVDGSGFIFRAFHALPSLTRGDGTPIGAVLGFTNMLVKLLEDKKATHLAVIFDAGRITFRNEIYAAYKAHRDETPPELIPQFSLIREACQVFGVPTVERAGFEADDLIATYSREATARNMTVQIVSSDKDLMQLVNEQVTLWDPIKNKRIGMTEVQEKFGVAPSQVTDVQALAGDSSDNIPGVPGIGIKTAAELIQAFGDVETLLNRASEIPQAKRRQNLIDFADQARISKQLVVLKQDVAHLPSLETLVVRPRTMDETLMFLREQGFRSLENRLNLEMGNKERKEMLSSEETSTSYEMVMTMDRIRDWVDQISKHPYVIVDTETDSLDAMKANLVGISLALPTGEACYIPVRHQPKVGLFEESSGEKIPYTQEEVLRTVGPMLMDPTVIKVGHNIKYDKLVLKKYGISIEPYEDTLLQSYLLQGGRHGLDALVAQHFDHKMISFKDVAGTGKSAVTFDHVPLKEATQYAAEDADYTGRLYRLFAPQLTEGALHRLYRTVDLPLVDVLVTMEQNGIKIDSQVLHDFKKELEQRLRAMETEIYEISGETFNIGSPKQLGEVLFDRLHLSGGKKNKLGAYGTGSDVLEELSAFHPLPQKILDWRHLAKLKSTYTDTLLQQVHPTTGRVHTSFAMAITSTSRLASSDPNLQNIPIRSEEGRKIRHAFIADVGAWLVSFDYSQIELRLMAHLAQVPTLMKAFQQGQDIHRITASQIFHTPLDQVSLEQRNHAKTINFGIIYGMSPFGLAKQLKIDRKDAAFLIEAYFKQYPGIREFIEETKDFARTHGYVETLWGRRLYVADIHSKNAGLRAMAERQAVNAPLQGTNADVVKMAMIQIQKMLETRRLKTKMLLQVHDELILECPEGELEIIKADVQQIMESVMTISIPLTVGIGVGKTWDACG